jgi:hypothetical protein
MNLLLFAGEGFCSGHPGDCQHHPGGQAGSGCLPIGQVNIAPVVYVA